MSEHTCYVPGCASTCGLEDLMCRRHWGMVPSALADEVVRAFAAVGAADGQAVPIAALYRLLDADRAAVASVTVQAGGI